MFYKKFFSIWVVVVSIATIVIFGKESGELETKQIKIGNFAVSGDQQMRPLIAFGQNIVDEGVAQYFVGINKTKGSQEKAIEVTPMYFIYGITDLCSLLLNVNVAAHFESEGSVSHGVEDIVVELEYIPYVFETATKINAISVVATCLVPTGSPDLKPFTGFGAPSYALGFTANCTATYWYCFASSGMIFPTSYGNNKFGNRFLYQCGFGRNILYKPDGWIFNWLLEFDGTYRQRDKMCGSINPNTGGNIILLGPSLWFSTQRFGMQAGISAIPVQHLFGNQSKVSYYTAAYLGCTFRF